MSVIKIATWNVNSLRTRLPHVLAWLATHQPDVLCVQETKVEDGLFPTVALLEAGWHAAFVGQKSYNGVALLSRVPLVDVVVGFGHGYDGRGQQRLIKATLVTAAGPLRVVSVYVPNGDTVGSEKFGYKQEFYAALAVELRAERADYPWLVVGGDFNVAVDARDVVDDVKAAKQVLFTPAEREWLGQMAGTAGLHDGLRCVEQGGGIFSWWDYRTYGRSSTNGMRIDYVWVSDALRSGVKQVWHDAEERRKVQPSDHVPVVLELKL
jgi:exodeoxyribonuclease III